MRKIRLMALVLFPAIVVTALAQTTPTDPAARKFVVSPMRVSQLKPMAYMYTEVETTFADMATVVSPALGNLISGMSEKGMVPGGPPVLEFENATFDPGKSFKLRIGFPVAEGAKPVAGFELGKLESAKSATVLFMGATRDLSAAYQRIFAQVLGQGMEMTGVRRERYLYTEDRSSPNNVVLIEILVK